MARRGRLCLATLAALGALGLTPSCRWTTADEVKRPPTLGQNPDSAPGEDAGQASLADAPGADVATMDATSLDGPAAVDLVAVDTSGIIVMASRPRSNPR